MGKDRLSRSLHRAREWCHAHRHDALRKQQQALAKKLCGHYGYFGVSSNYRALRFYRETRHAWQKWLSRRSNAGYVDRARMLALLERFPLPPSRIAHRYGT
jgi:hypothetical protein